MLVARLVEKMYLQDLLASGQEQELTQLLLTVAMYLTSLAQKVLGIKR